MTAYSQRYHNRPIKIILKSEPSNFDQTTAVYPHMNCMRSIHFSEAYICV
jgi:hypothetical protein